MKRLAAIAIISGSKERRDELIRLLQAEYKYQFLAYDNTANALKATFEEIRKKEHGDKTAVIPLAFVLDASTMDKDVMQKAGQALLETERWLESPKTVAIVKTLDQGFTATQWHIKSCVAEEDSLEKTARALGAKLSELSRKDFAGRQLKKTVEDRQKKDRPSTPGFR